MIRKSLPIALLLFLAVLIWTTGRTGFASLLHAYAARANQLAPAETAVKLSPRDAQAHYVRGALLEARRDMGGAAQEFAQAVSLRPRDNFLWLALARARELSGDRSGAIAAANEGAVRAPFYAQPHWQLGNLLLRAGNSESGFGELRLATASDPSLLPATVDLAWHLSNKNTDYVLQAIQPRRPEAYKALAEYFAKRGETEVAAAMIEAAGEPAESERRAFVAALIAAKDFRSAFTLWAKRHPRDPDGPMMRDGSFEQESDLDEPGFGWRALNKPQGFSLSLDDTNPKTGKWGLAVNFDGQSDPSESVISQLVLIEPRARYQLHLAARTEELVSGGLPYVSVIDATTQQPLGQTPAFPRSSNWLDYTIDVTAPDTATAIQVMLRRQACNTTPCPAFGRMWLDDFWVRKQ